MKNTDRQTNRFQIHACTDLSQSYIFVSYSHKDTDLVADLLRLMQENHFRFWYDEGIESGSHWDDVLYDRITGCSQFVCFFSHNAVESEHVKNEVHLARKYGKQILPVFLDDVTLRGGLELALDRQQSLTVSNYTSEEFRRQFCRALDRHALEKIVAASDSVSRELESRYRIASQIGSGFSGNVYLADNLHTGGKVVIKHVSLDESYTGDAIRSAYQNECIALSGQASCHAPIVLDFLSDEHNIFLVETFVKGTSLHKLKDLTDLQIVDIFRKTARVLQQFHDAGIVHCDVKPEHILVHGDEVFLVDFGACHIDGRCNDNHTIGTLHYAAPEQFGSPMNDASPCTVDARSDIFALGKSLLFVLAANHGILDIKDMSKTTVLNPDVTFYAKKNTYEVDADRYREEIHPLLQAVIDKMTAQRPDKRFSSMAEVDQCLAVFEGIL